MADALVERLDQVIELVLTGADATAALSDAELSPLAVLTLDLRRCPRRAFKTRLRSSLERRMTMVTVLEGAKIREGFTTVTPYLRVREPGMLEFLTAAFDAVETFSAAGAGGSVHREVRVGDSMLMIAEGGPEGVVGFSPAAFHVFVPDVDAAFARAIAAGAKSMGVPEDRPYGERAGFVEDAFGNHWYIATHLGSSPVPPGHRTVTSYIHQRNLPTYIDFLKRALGAVEEFRHEVHDVVVHARIRIGDGAIEMGDAQGQIEPTKTAFYLYVADCDALYQQAVSAGARSVMAPGDRPYGDRTAVVRDEFGITWCIATPV